MFGLDADGTYRDMTNAEMDCFTLDRVEKRSAPVLQMGSPADATESRPLVLLDDEVSALCVRHDLHQSVLESKQGTRPRWRPVQLRCSGRVQRGHGSAGGYKAPRDVRSDPPAQGRTGGSAHPGRECGNIKQLSAPCAIACALIDVTRTRNHICDSLECRDLAAAEKIALNSTEFATQQFIGDDAQLVDVALNAERQSRLNLWRAVERGVIRHFTGSLRVRHVSHASEVGNEWPVSFNDDVTGLDVPVNHSSRVDRHQATSDLDRVV